MLPKKERLSRAAFDRFFASGRRHHTPYFTIIYSPAEHFYGAVVVGKKVHKKAVDRNALRRRLYSVLYRWQRREEQTGTYIILTKPALTEVSRNELTSLLTEALAHVAKRAKKR